MKMVSEKKLKFCGPAYEVLFYEMLICLKYLKLINILIVLQSQFFVSIYCSIIINNKKYFSFKKHLKNTFWTTRSQHISK